MSGVSVARIANSVRNVVRAHDGRDDQEAAVRIARLIASGMENGAGLDRALVLNAMREAGTQPFRRFGIRKDELADEVVTELRALVPSLTLDDWIARFRQFSIRQLARDLSERAEAPIRSHLQTFLAAKYHTFREVESGKGRTDILVGTREGDIIEVKVWRDQRYFDDGIVELTEYLRTEGKALGYYVVVAYNDTVVPRSQENTTITRDGKTILVRWIVMPAVAPSKLALQRRKANAT